MERLKRFIPPIVVDLYHQAAGRHGFFGDYATWQEAKGKSIGYDSEVILEKVKKALLLVKEGKALYERDSVIFDKISYPWPLLAGLLRIAGKNRNKLTVADYGGSLGTTYFQCRNFLSDLDSLSWNVIEQPNFVNCGKRYFEDETLRFFYDLDLSVQETGPDILLLSSVLQYLEKPYEFIEKAITLRIPYILIDRTAFLLHGDDRLTVQKVPPTVYQASYPAWFFNERKFLDSFLTKYDLIADFKSADMANIPSVYKGFIFNLRDDQSIKKMD